MSKHGKTSFQDAWLSDPKFKEWLKKCDNDRFYAECILCPGTRISLASMGRRALTSHSDGAKHKNKVHAMQKSLPLSIFKKPSDRSVTAGSTVGGQTPSTSTGSCSAAEPCTSRTTEPTTATTASNTSTLTTTAPRGLKKFLLSEDVTKAEILWALQTVMTHKSMSSAGKDVNLFQMMFPDSEIAKNMQLQRKKINYTIVFGLAPFFKLQVLKKLENCDFFVVAFDESLNKISQRQQMDIVVRFWDADVGEVATRYLTSAFLTAGKATDLLHSFKQSLEGLDLGKVLQVSMDGPNVNLAFLRELQQELIESGTQHRLLNFGSCGIHTVHNGFKTALIKTDWDIPRFLRALYNLFKDVPARRGIYIRLTSSQVFPLKFCAIRWLENSSVAQRAIDILPNLKKFVNGVEEEKCAPTSSSYLTVKEFVKDPLIGPKLAFFKTLATDAEPYLTDFQSNWPLTPFIHTGLSCLVDTLMERVAKKTSDTNFTEEFLKNSDNLLHFKKIDVGFATKLEISKTKLTDSQVADFRKDCKGAIVNFVLKLFEKSPLKYPLTKYLTSVDPAVVVQDIGKQRFDKLLEKLVEFGWITGSAADRATHQYKIIASTPSLRSKLESFSRKKDRLDHFWVALINDSEIEGYEILKVLKLVSCLSHGNAEVERGFSVNKECLQDNMAEETLIGFRSVYDSVQKMGGVEKVEISKSMIHYARNAHARQKEFQEKKNKARQEEDEKKMNLKRKEKEIQELVEKRQKVLEEAHLLKDKILELRK